MNNISRSTIINYLKKGKELGWCNYNPKEENKKITDKNLEFYKKSRKKIEVFKNDISLGVFESITYVEKHSMELFGVQVSNKNILLISVMNSVVVSDLEVISFIAIPPI